MGLDRIWLVCIAMLACGHGSSQSPPVYMDAPAMVDAGPCWPMDTSTPKGTLQLGTGDPSSFVPMPDQINLVYGSQGGFHVPTLGLMTGLNPGDPQNVLDPTNPRSFYRAFLMNGQPAYDYGPCPSRYGYIPGPGGSGSITPAVIEARFYECMGPNDLFYKQFMVKGEVIDSTGGYATDEKVVTVLPPYDWPDAGIPDAPGSGSDAGPPPDANGSCPPTTGQ